MLTWIYKEKKKQKKEKKKQKERKKGETKNDTKFKKTRQNAKEIEKI